MEVYIMKTLKHFCNGLLLGALFASNAVAMDDVAVVPNFDGANFVDTSSLVPAIGQFDSCQQLVDSSGISFPPSVDFQNFDKKENNQSVEQLSGPWYMSDYYSRGLIKAVGSDHECKVYVNRAGDSTVVSHNGTIFTLNPGANKLFIYSMSDNGWQLTQEIENALKFRLYEKQNILVVAIKGEIKGKNEKTRPSVKRKDKDKKKDKNEKPRPFLRIYERTNSGWEKKSNIQFKLNCWNDDYIDISSHFSVAQDGKTFFVTRFINEKQQSTLSIYKKVNNDWVLKQEINDVENYFCYHEGMLFVRNNDSSYFCLKRNKKQVALLEEMNDGSWKVKLTFFSSDSLGIEKPVVFPDKNKFFLDKRLFCKNQQGVWKDAKVTFSTKKNETFRSFVFLSNEEFLVRVDHSDVLDLFLKFKHKNPTWVSSESWILDGEFILPGELQNNLFIEGHSDQADVFLRPYRKKGSFEGDDLIIHNRLNDFQVIKWVSDFHVMHGGKFILVVSSGEKTIRLYEKDENGKYRYKNTFSTFTNFHRVNVYHQEFFAICSTEGSYDLYQLTEDGQVIEKLHSTHLSNIFLGENKEMLFIQTKPCDEEYIQNIFVVGQDMPVEWGMTGQKRGPAYKNKQLQGKRKRT